MDNPVRKFVYEGITYIEEGPPLVFSFDGMTEYEKKDFLRFIARRAKEFSEET